MPEDAMTAKMARFRAFVLDAAKKIAPPAAHIVEAGAVDVIDEKDFILYGKLKGSGRVSYPEVVEDRGETVVECVVSFPMVYAPWIEFGVRNDPRYGVVTMKVKEPGFLHEGGVRKAKEVDDFVAGSWHNAMLAFAARERAR